MVKNFDFPPARFVYVISKRHYNFYYIFTFLILKKEEQDST